MKKHRPKKLEIVLFRDHASGTKEPLVCFACGFLVADTEKHLSYTWWHTEGLSSLDEIEANQEHFTIVKSAIIRRFGFALPKGLVKLIDKFL